MEAENCDTVVLAAPITDTSKFAFDRRKMSLLSEEGDSSAPAKPLPPPTDIIITPKVEVTRPKYNVRMCN